MSSLLTNAKQYPLSNLAYQSYEFVASESFYDMWDVTAAVWLSRPDLYAAPETKKLAVVTEDNGMQGALVPSDNGRAIEVVLSFTNSAGFYDYVLQQLAR